MLELGHVLRGSLSYLAFLQGKGQLAEDLGCTEREAETMMASFRNSLPGIRRWQESLIEQCRRDTFVTTSAGRRRWLTAIRAANGRKRSQAERQACNTVCQVCYAAA